MGEIFSHILQKDRARADAELKVATAQRIQDAKDESQQRRDVQRQAEQAAAEQRRQHEKAIADAAAAEKARLGAPTTKRVMKKNYDAIPVWHWKVPSCPVPLVGAPRGQGPVAFLPHGGGVVGSPKWLSRFDTSLVSNPDFQTWTDDTQPIREDAGKRYPLLKNLRNRAWWGELMEAADIAMTNSIDKPWTGQYGSGTRRVTVITVPAITAVKVAPDGLRVRVAHRMGDSAKRWATKLDVLRSGFKAAGVAAGDLKISEAKNGDILLFFGDADPFAEVPSTVTPYDDARGRSLLGITSTGQQAWITWSGSCVSSSDLAPLICMNFGPVQR